MKVKSVTVVLGDFVRKTFSQEEIQQFYDGYRAAISTVENADLSHIRLMTPERQTVQQITETMIHVYRVETLHDRVEEEGDTYEVTVELETLGVEV